MNTKKEILEHLKIKLLAHYKFNNQREVNDESIKHAITVSRIDLLEEIIKEIETKN